MNDACAPEALDEYRQRLQDMEPAQPPSAHAHRRKARAFNPRRVLVLTFLLLILAGACLLNTPWAQASGCWSWEVPGEPFAWGRCARALLDNLFMATSASCVTGLAVVDIATTYSTFGQVVLGACIQLGGLSLMTLGTVIIALLLGRVTIEGEEQVRMNYGASSGRARLLLGQTVRYVFTFEAVGVLLLFVSYSRHGYPALKSLGYATFHAISAFCNAGLSLHPESLQCFRGDLLYTLTIATLVTLGGIGFLVLANVFHYHFWRRNLLVRGRISLHSRIVLWATLILCAGGGLLFTILEWDASLASSAVAPVWDTLVHGNWSELLPALQGAGEKIATGFSQAAIFRTAGFNLVPMAELTPPTNMLSTLLMLIGGSPGSMAGGIKTTTLVVLLLTIRAYIRGNPAVQVHRRTLSNAICREAMVIVFFYLATVFVFYFVLLLTESALVAKQGDFALFYEVTSAVGTVGASLDVTPHLSLPGRAILALAMFLGRIGPISIVLAMSGRKPSGWIRYPEESVTVG